jgi:hypothetical protein
MRLTIAATSNYSTVMWSRLQIFVHVCLHTPCVTANLQAHTKRRCCCTPYAMLAFQYIILCTGTRSSAAVIYAPYCSNKGTGMRPGRCLALLVCVCTSLAYVAYVWSPPAAAAAAAAASRKLADGTPSDSPDITWYPESQPDFDPDREYTLVYVHAALRSDGAGPDILREQLEHIRTTGLWDKMDFLFIGVLGGCRAKCLLLCKCRCSCGPLHVCCVSRNHSLACLPCVSLHTRRGFSDTGWVQTGRQAASDI